MNSYPFRLFVCVLMFMISAQSFAQELLLRLGAEYQVEMKNGDQYEGKLKEFDAEIATFEGKNGVLFEIDKSGIRSLKMIDANDDYLEAEGEIADRWSANSLNASEVRYFLNSSGFGLKTGEAYYQNSYLVLNSFHYGISDHFSIGVAFDFYTLFLGQPSFSIIPKLSIPLQENIQLGVNVAYVHLGWGDYLGVFAILPQVTFGSPANNFTLGLGAAANTSGDNSPIVFNASGMLSVSRRISFVSENYLSVFDSSVGFLLTYGARFQASRLSVDLGLVNISDLSSDWPLGVPYVGFAVKF